MKIGGIVYVRLLSQWEHTSNPIIFKKKIFKDIYPLALNTTPTPAKSNALSNLTFPYTIGH